MNKGKKQKADNSCFVDSSDIQILTSQENPKENFCFFLRNMKIQCDVCEKAPATLICCADEAALCAKCDVEVHAANKLASKHQRLFLDSLSTKFPPCDICLVRIPPLLSFVSIRICRDLYLF